MLSVEAEIRPVDVRTSPSWGRVMGDWLGVFFCALLVYVLTAHPGEQWQDNGEQQLRVIENRIEHRQGLALVHPISFWLGRIAIQFFPNEPAYGVTMVSVIASAAAAANVYSLLRLLVAQWMPAVVGAVSLVFAHTFWQNATVTESYGLVCFTLTSELLCLSWYARSGDERALIAGAFFNGIGVANHLLNALVTPVHFAAVGLQIRRGFVRGHTLLMCLVVWLLAFSPYLVLIVQKANEVGAGAAIASALFGDFGRAATALQAPTKLILMGCAYVLFNFPNLALPFAAYGAALVPIQRRLYQVLLVDGLILFLFAVRYDVADQYSFFAPFYVIVAIFFGVGVDAFLRLIPVSQRAVVSSAVLLTTLANPLIYHAAFTIAKSNKLFVSMVGNKPYRDGYAHFFLPWNEYKRHARVLNDQVYGLVGGNGLVVCGDTMIKFGLRYPRAIGRAPQSVEQVDVHANATEAEFAAMRGAVTRAWGAGRPVVFVPRDRDVVPEWVPGAKWERIGDVYKLVDLALP